MAKVTSKLQLTIPRSIADRYGIRTGDQLEFVAAGDTIRLIPAEAVPLGITVEERLALFDAATERQLARQAGTERQGEAGEDRGWTREELYDRARPR
jgi:AbrB family looped-hinge helix DNA binding protein